MDGFSLLSWTIGFSFFGCSDWTVELFLLSFFLSFPKRIVAPRSLKNSEIPYPVLAEISLYLTPKSAVFSSILPLSTDLSSFRSTLLAKIMIITFSPLISLTDSIHLFKLLKVVEDVRSKTIMAAEQSLIYDGISEWNLYWPAVSQSCILRTRLSKLIVLETKSTPMVG